MEAKSADMWKKNLFYVWVIFLYYFNERHWTFKSSHWEKVKWKNFQESPATLIIVVCSDLFAE